MRRAFLLTACLAVSAAAPAPAGAVDPGVHVDPGSPAGKEYALPLEQARRDARGGGSSSDLSSSNSAQGGGSKLFGEGIRKATAGSGRASARARHETAPAERLSVPAASSSGGSTAPTDLGIALAVLAAAGVLGLGLRRALR